MNDPGATRRDFLSGHLTAKAQADNKSLQDEAPSAPAPLSPDRLLTRLSKRAMACPFEFFVDTRRFPLAAEVAQRALELVEAIESELTLYRPESHLSAVNRQAFDATVNVSPRLRELLAPSLALHRETGGAFDVTAGPLTKVWGFYHRKPIVPTSSEIERALATVGSQFVEFDSHASTVRFLRPNLEINLAAIGKGYALDCCAELMQQEAISEFVLHGGQSSVVARGVQDQARPEWGWPIGIVHPVFPQLSLGCVHLRDRALGTSGSQRQWIVHHGRRLGHVLDPRTGWPASHVLSATVLAPTAALADALSTAFSVMSLDEVEAYCRSHPEIATIIATVNASKPNLPKIHRFNVTDEIWRPLPEA
jgi:thiamine biosynthesis lipoprotein